MLLSPKALVIASCSISVVSSIPNGMWVEDTNSPCSESSHHEHVIVALCHSDFFPVLIFFFYFLTLFFFCSKSEAS